MDFTCLTQRHASTKIKRTYQIFDAEFDLLLDTENFEKAMRKAKSTPDSRINVRGSFMIDFEFEHFEFGFKSPSANTSDEAIESYIELRAEEEMQKLRDRFSRRQETRSREKVLFKF